ncbi:MAG: hypothetical protein ACLU6B_11440 [Lachnospirales bacterium]
MERIIHLYRAGHEVGAYSWSRLPLREEAILARSQDLFGHRKPCARQRRAIRTALLFELERALASSANGRPPLLWKRYVQAPECDRIRWGQR